MSRKARIIGVCLERHLAQYNDGVQHGPGGNKPSVQCCVFVQNDGMKAKLQAAAQKHVHGYDVVETALIARPNLRIA